MGTKKISSFGIASSIVSVILFAFMFSAVCLALQEGFGFENLVFMMVEHVCLQCFQKFRVHTAYAQILIYLFFREMGRAFPDLTSYSL